MLHEDVVGGQANQTRRETIFCCNCRVHKAYGLEGYVPQHALYYVTDTDADEGQMGESSGLMHHMWDK